MTTPVLERAGLQVPQTNLDPALATRARLVLNYRAAADIIEENRRAIAQILPVKEAFEALGIEPFSNESVERYKQAKLREVNHWVWLSEWANSDTGGLPNFLVSAAVGIVSMGALLWTGPKIMFHNPTVYAWFLPLVAALYCTFIVTVALHGPQLKFKWAKTPLSKYREPVPEFATSRAIDLKELYPDVAFYVDELKVDKVVADPFLIAQIGRESYYIDVWDEPAFEGRRTK